MARVLTRRSELRRNGLAYHEGREGFHQAATYGRKKSEKELAYEAMPRDSRVFVEMPILTAFLPDHCGSIGISVDVPRFKVRKARFSFGLVRIEPGY